MLRKNQQNLETSIEQNMSFFDRRTPEMQSFYASVHAEHQLPNTEYREPIERENPLALSINENMFKSTDAIKSRNKRSPAKKTQNIFNKESPNSRKANTTAQKKKKSTSSKSPPKPGSDKK